MSKYEEHYDEWVRLYTEEGLRVSEIKRRFGCGANTVRQLLVSRDAYRPPASWRERLARYTDRRAPDECWPWTSTQSLGYGQLRVGGKYVRATHLALEAAGQPKPYPDACACHTCDNPPCVNPNHLFWGTHGDNAQDKVEKGRSLAGEGHPRATLTDEDVSAIREEYEAGDVRQADLAEKYGTSQTHVSRITRGVVREPAMGFVGSLRGAEAVVYHRDRGRVGEFAYAVPTSPLD